MRRIRCIALILGVTAAAAWLVPGVASAASVFNWTLASDFTATGAGANPDHDQYGDTPWSYVEGQAGNGVTFSHDPSTFTPLSSFATGVRGGLAGWSDPTDPDAFVGINPTDSTITQSPVKYPAHAIALQPPSDRLIAVGWTSPFPQPTQVAVTGSVTADNASLGCLIGAPQWSLDQNGSQLLSGTPTNGAISTFVTVPAGGTIYLTAVHGSTANCSILGLSLSIQAAAPAPTVTLATPAPGAEIAGAQPTFSGSASQNFGDSSQVTVRVYSGTAASGTPLETLTTTASGGTYQVQPSSPLGDGTYTAQAEHDDLLSPPVAGLSSPVTFTIANGGPKVTLDPLGSGALGNASPTLTGTAGTASGDTKSVTIAIFSGSGENGQPVRTLTAAVTAKGTFSTKVTPPLDDGTYTAVAAQKGADATGISAALMFTISAAGPSVTITTPAAGASISSPLPVIAGTAGAGANDSSTIVITLYRGPSIKSKRVGRVNTTAANGKWIVLWPHQLPLGLYTVQASQSDNAGHTALSAPHRFLITPGKKVIGSTVVMKRSGAVSLPISCLAGPGVTCAGDVSVVTKKRFRPSAGGPAGRLRLLFQFVQVRGGQTVAVHGKVNHTIARLLRRAAPLKVTVTIELKVSGRVVSKLTGDATLRLH